MNDILHDDYASEGFVLGTPSLVCRWRLAGRTLPLENRHLRALAARRPGGKQVSQALVAWAKQHIEWTLAEGAAQWPDGVLMLVVDELGQAAMTVGPYEPLAATRFADLLIRADAAAQEAAQTVVAPETLWLVASDVLLWGIERDWKPSGAASLVFDLAHTLGMRVEKRPGLARAAAERKQRYAEAFLVSDEHGIVPARDASGDVARRFAEGYSKLFASKRR